MPGTSANFDHLIDLFSDIERWMAVSQQGSLGGPAPGSALAEDNRRLGIYPGTHLVLAGLTGAIDHLDAFRQLIVKARALHLVAPVTLLRSVLEEAGFALWLVHPGERQERLLRALRAHHRDMNDRAEYEKVRPPVLGPKGKTASARCRQIREIAASLGFDQSRVAGTLSASVVIDQACEALGPAGADGPRLWRLSSGLAHGRHWTVMHGYELQDAWDSGGGYAALQVASNEDLVTGLATLGHELVGAAVERYQLLARSHR
ncbi:hypothetical protein AB0I34_39980 [Kribbella sp. NPDC050281]|uniref:hypothetical protein n=1 Tax=Kribbella sp. NPDC050281 TaxID=3155515 RepID=UPI0033E33AE1